METTLAKTFENVKFGKIRVAVIDDMSWFVAADICKSLGYANSTMALSKLDDDEKATFKLDRASSVVTTLNSNEGTNDANHSINQNLNFVNEYGLYNLILGSRKKEAKEFKRWVTHEVLPSIRKTGSYGTATAAPYVLIPKFFRGKQVITVKDAAVILNTSRSLIESIINKPTGNIHEGKDYYRLKGDKRAEFKEENPSVPAAVHHIIAILESGFKKICDYMLVETPPIFRVENLETKLELDFYCYKYKLEPMTEIEEMICSYANARRVLSIIKRVYEGNKKIEEECNDLLALLLLLINEKNFYKAPVGAMIKNERLSEAKAV